MIAYETVDALGQKIAMIMHPRSLVDLRSRVPARAGSRSPGLSQIVVAGGLPILLSGIEFEDGPGEGGQGGGEPTILQGVVVESGRDDRVMADGVGRVTVLAGVGMQGGGSSH